jgi:hypothetical protein
MRPPSRLSQKTLSGGEIQDYAGLLVSNVFNEMVVVGETSRSHSKCLSKGFWAPMACGCDSYLRCFELRSILSENVNCEPPSTCSARCVGSVDRHQCPLSKLAASRGTRTRLPEGTGPSLCAQAARSCCCALLFRRMHHRPSFVLPCLT